MKRFYKTADIAPHDKGGYVVTLDDKPIRTPAHKELHLPVLSLAAAIAGEWQAQGDEVRPVGMPNMRLACTAIDRVTPRHEAVVGELVSYGGSDLLCYRSDNSPELALLQDESWQPLLDMAAIEYRAPLVVTSGIIPVNQPPMALENIRKAIEAHDSMMLAALHSVTSASGSLILGLLLADSLIDAHRVFSASRVDEDFQMEKWGEDKEAMDRSRALKEDIEATSAFMRLCRAG